MEKAGVSLQYARTANEGLAILSSSNSRIGLAIVDILLPCDDDHERELIEVASAGGVVPTAENSGLVLGMWIHKHRPDIKFFFYSQVPGSAHHDLRKILDPTDSKFVDKDRAEYQHFGFVQFVTKLMEGPKT